MSSKFNSVVHRILSAVTLFLVVSAIVSPVARAGFIPPFTITNDTDYLFSGFINYVCSICVGGTTSETAGTKWQVKVTENQNIGSVDIAVQGQHQVGPDDNEVAPAAFLNRTLMNVVAGGAAISLTPASLEHDPGPHSDIIT